MYFMKKKEKKMSLNIALLFIIINFYNAHQSFILSLVLPFFQLSAFMLSSPSSPSSLYLPPNCPHPYIFSVSNHHNYYYLFTFVNILFC